MRAVAPIVRDVDRIDERLNNTLSALNTLRSDINDRLRAQQDMQSRALQDEITDLQTTMREIVERRDRELADIRKAIGDCGITAADLNRQTRADLGEKIGALQQNQAAIGADRTSRRGQNITALVTLAGALLLLLGTVIERLFG